MSALAAHGDRAGALEQARRYENELGDVDYVGTRKVDQSKIDEKLKEKQLQIRLDSFIDPGIVRQVAGVVRELYAEKGYQYAQIKPEIKEVAGGPKTVHLTFNIEEGPKVRIDDIDHRHGRHGADRQGRSAPAVV